MIPNLAASRAPVMNLCMVISLQAGIGEFRTSLMGPIDTVNVAKGVGLG